MLTCWPCATCTCCSATHCSPCRIATDSRASWRRDSPLAQLVEDAVRAVDEVQLAVFDELVDEGLRSCLREPGDREQLATPCGTVAQRGQDQPRPREGERARHVERPDDALAPVLAHSFPSRAFDED